MSKIHFHAEVFEGVPRVQVGSLGPRLEHDVAACLARAVIALAGPESRGFAQVVFESPGFRARHIDQRLGELNLSAHVAEGRAGIIARTLGLDPRPVQISEIPLDRLVEVLELCWEQAPLFFGLAANSLRIQALPPNLRAVVPDVEYLKQWHSLGAVFHHGEWVAFSAAHLAMDDLVRTVVDCFGEQGWECVASPGPL